jgi:uncharacterized membrane protein/protein-disulfide isomerase
VTSENADVAPLALMAPSRSVVWVIRGLAVVALGVSSYLAWTALTMGEVYGCGSGTVFDCGHVLTSRWSKWFGIPVSIPAMALWGSILAVLAFARTRFANSMQHWIWSTVTLGGFAAGIAAIWFIILQVFVIEHLCTYCLVAHSCGLILAGLMLWMHPAGKRWTSLMAAPAVAGATVLAVGQVLSPIPQTYVVERFETAESDATVPNGDMTETEDSGELIEAPGEFFGPPGEFFAPPSDAVSVDEPGPSSEVGKRADEASGDSAVAAANLLLINSAGWLPRHVLSDVLFASPVAAMQESNESGAGSQEDRTEGEGQEVDKDVPATAKPKERLVSVQGKKFVLNTRQWPLIGEPDARYVFVEMLDYTCPHCRHTHRAVKGACKRFGNDLAIVVLPVPLNRACNSAASGGGHTGACELGILAVAVWRIDRSKFAQFHDWLMEGGRSRTPSEARRRAEQLVGTSVLKAEMDKKVAAAYIKRHVDLYRRVGAGSVPKLMFPNATMTGEVSSTTTLCNRIERELSAR